MSRQCGAGTPPTGSPTSARASTDADGVGGDRDRYGTAPAGHRAAAISTIDRRLAREFTPRRHPSLADRSLGRTGAGSGYH